MPRNNLKGQPKEKLIPWQKGQSGNPTGRRKVSDEVKAAFREMTPEAVERLRAIVQDPLHKDHFRAIERVLDQTVGKPVVPIGLEPDDGAQARGAGSLSQCLAALAAAVGAGTAGAPQHRAMVGQAPPEPDTADRS